MRRFLKKTDWIEVTLCTSALGLSLYFIYHFGIEAGVW